MSRELNCILGRKNASDTLPVHTSNVDLANKFKDYFIDKIDNINENFPDSLGSYNYTAELPVKIFDKFSPITDENVTELISQMNKTHCQNDPIDVRGLDFNKFPDIFSYYCDIINLSFQTGKFPEEEKFAYVRPLIKKGGDPDKLASYRPLYNTSFLSKLIEIAMLNQLISHMDGFHNLPSFQSAYRNAHSVESALCRVYNDLVKTKANGDCSMLILLDLSSAFDTIDHILLLDELELMGIRGSALNLIRSYLSNRGFCVTIENDVSEVGFMKSGVPQGTIMGPFLFIIYTASLQYVLESLGVSYHLYADDTQIYFKITDKHADTDKLNQISSTINEWMMSRKLKLNLGKTDIMIIGSEAKLTEFDFEAELMFGESGVQRSTKLNNLGVIFDEHLLMKQQLNNSKKKAICALINIAKISTFTNRIHRTQLVHSLVLSQLDYCNSLYYGIPNQDLNTMQMIINSAARIIVGMPRYSRERITPVCIDLHFLPIKARVEYKICLLAFKALFLDEPKYLADLLKPYATSSALELRSNGRLDEPFITRAASISRCFEYCAPRLFNSLPQDVKGQVTINSFKKKLKTHLFSKSYNLSTLTTHTEYST